MVLTMDLDTLVCASARLLHLWHTIQWPIAPEIWWSHIGWAVFMVHMIYHDFRYMDCPYNKTHTSLDDLEIKLTISVSIYCTCPMWFFAAAASVKDSMICTQELYLASKKRIVMTSYTLIKFSSSNLFQLWIIGTSTYSFHSCSCPCPSAQTAFAYFRSPYWILISPPTFGF